MIILSDWHIGLCYKNMFGQYNSDIAKTRLSYLLQKILEIQKSTKSDDAHIIVLGDIISGNIHKSIQVTNRENVIEQIKIATELLTSFIYEISRKFTTVTVTSCPGNHSRLDRKDDAINDERLDDLIAWAYTNKEKSLTVG